MHRLLALLLEVQMTATASKVSCATFAPSAEDGVQASKRPVRTPCWTEERMRCTGC